MNILKIIANDISTLILGIGIIGIPSFLGINYPKQSLIALGVIFVIVFVVAYVQSVIDRAHAKPTQPEQKEEE